jgi:hypothetical protein
MSGGFIISVDRGLFRRVAAALVDLGGVVAMDDVAGEVVQLTDADGHLFTLYERVVPGTEWEVSGEPVMAAPGVVPPDMQGVIACPFECRWPELVARIADRAAGTAEAPTWLLDGDGVVWDAESVDPTRVRL